MPEVDAAGALVGGRIEPVVRAQLADPLVEEREHGRPGQNVSLDELAQLVVELLPIGEEERVLERPISGRAASTPQIPLTHLGDQLASVPDAGVGPGLPSGIEGPLRVELE